MNFSHRRILRYFVHFDSKLSKLYNEESKHLEESKRCRQEILITFLIPFNKLAEKTKAS